MRKKKVNYDQQEILISDDSENTEIDNLDQYEPDEYESFEKELSKYDEEKKKKPKDREYYVKGADLIEEIKKYQTSKKLDAEKRGVPLEEGIGDISEELGVMLIKIATRFSMHPRFYRIFIQR